MGGRGCGDCERCGKMDSNCSIYSPDTVIFVCVQNISNDPKIIMLFFFNIHKIIIFFVIIQIPRHTQYFMCPFNV